MTDKIDLSKMTSYLFECNFFDDEFDPEDHEEHLACAEKLFDTYAFKDIFNEWNNYLRKNCKTAEEVINFCNLFSYYGGQDYPIPNAYDFVGYIYSKVDISKYWDEAGDFIDGLCTSILEKSGEISLVKDPYYQSWKDPKVLEAVERIKKQS